MIKENRLMVRLIALWIIFVASLGLSFWSVENLTMSVVKMANGGYQSPAMAVGMGMGYGTTYSSCLIPPTYPQYPSMGMMPGDNSVDPVTMTKYSKDLEKYNSDYAAACRADVDKQEKTQTKQEKSLSSSDITVYSILSLLGIFSAVLSSMAIRKSEEM